MKKHYNVKHIVTRKVTPMPEATFEKLSKNKNLFIDVPDPKDPDKQIKVTPFHKVEECDQHGHNKKLQKKFKAKHTAEANERAREKLKKSGK